MGKPRDAAFRARIVRQRGQKALDEMRARWAAKRRRRRYERKFEREYGRMPDGPDDAKDVRRLMRGCPAGCPCYDCAFDTVDEVRSPRVARVFGPT